MKDMFGCNFASLFFSVCTFGWPAAAANVLDLKKKKMKDNDLLFKIYSEYNNEINDCALDISGRIVNKTHDKAIKGFNDSSQVGR